MALFGGYEMPLWYGTGAKAEHLAVLQSAGIFDTSHMAAIRIDGDGARALLQCCFSKDLDRCVGPRRQPLTCGRCVYGVFLNTDASVLDDAIVYALTEKSFMIVVNAGMGSAIAARLKEYASGNVVIEDLTDAIGKFDVQGPKAAKILQKLLVDPQKIFDRLPYFSFKGGFASMPVDREIMPVLLSGNIPILLSRTGYTGEFGFEIFLALDDFPGVWQMILDAGEAEGMLSCGLAARDSLRAGAVLPLSHQDIGPWPFAANPWLFALPWNDNQSAFTKDFLGGSALAAISQQDYTLPFAGYDPRKIVPGEGTGVLDVSGENIGEILTCATDMAIGRMKNGDIVSIASPPASRPADFQAKGLCCGFVKLKKLLPPGEKILLTDGKKKITVEIRSDVRPDRTARVPISAMLDENEPRGTV